MSKRDQEFLRAIDGHVRMYSTLSPEDTQDLLALAWRGARGSEHKKLKAEITRFCAEVERLRAALELFACDCSESELCKFPHACRNYIARAALDGQPAPGKEEA